MAKKNLINLDGVSFSRAEIEKYETEGDFLKTMENETYGHVFEGPKREEKLKQLFQLAQPKTEDKTPEPPAKGAKPPKPTDEK